MPFDLRDHPVFICGHPKSGTSLLRSLFDSHPQLVVYPEETSFFRRYLPEAQGLSLDEKIALADRLLIHIFTWNQAAPPPSQAGFPDRDYSAVPFEAVSRALREQISQYGCRHDGDLLSAAVLGFGQASGCLSDSTRWWVEKTPYNEYYTERIFAWWPEARCIHIVRDPRDNYASYQRKHIDWTAEGFAASWMRSTRAGLQNQERYGEQRYIIYRYEDLVHSPEKVLQEMRDFLGIRDDPSLQIPTRNGVAWQGNSMFAEKFQAISEAPKDRWKQNLAAGEAGVIGLMAAALIRRFHYEVQTPVPLSAYLRRIRWSLAQAASRVRHRKPTSHA